MNWPRFVPCLILGAMPVMSAAAQDLPDPLPPLPPAIATATATVPMVIPPPVVLGSPAMSPVVDPVTLARHGPKNVDRKRESFHWRRRQGKFWGYPEEFQPRPLGSAIYDHGRTMVGNGEAARLMLHQYDFMPGSNELNDRGLQQLEKHVAKLADGPYPLVIEATPDNPTLAENRRAAILNATARWPVPLPPDRVVVGRSRSTGLSGIDAQIIGANGMDRAAKYGPPIPIQSNGVNSPSGVTGQ